MLRSKRNVFVSLGAHASLQGRSAGSRKDC